MTYKLFAVSAPGLEQITRDELEQMGYKTQPVQINPSGAKVEEVGGVEFEARPADLYRANLQLRTASRIISRLGTFDAVGI